MYHLDLTDVLDTSSDTSSVLPYFTEVLKELRKKSDHRSAQRRKRIPLHDPDALWTSRNSPPELSQSHLVRSIIKRRQAADCDERLYPLFLSESSSTSTTSSTCENLNDESSELNALEGPFPFFYKGTKEFPLRKRLSRQRRDSGPGLHKHGKKFAVLNAHHFSRAGEDSEKFRPPRCSLTLANHSPLQSLLPSAKAHPTHAGLHTHRPRNQPLLSLVNPFDIPEPRYSNTRILRKLQNSALSAPQSSKEIFGFDLSEQNPAPVAKRPIENPPYHSIPSLSSRPLFAGIKDQFRYAPTQSVSSTEDTPKLVQAIHHQLDQIYKSKHKPKSVKIQTPKTSSSGANTTINKLSDEQERSTDANVNTESGNVFLLNEILREPEGQKTVGIQATKQAEKTTDNQEASKGNPDDAGLSKAVEQITSFFKSFFA